MRLVRIAFLVFCGVAVASSQKASQMEDNEFAEFEEFDDEDEPLAIPSSRDSSEGASRQNTQKESAHISTKDNEDDDEVKLEDEEEEEEEEFDEEEFEGLDQERLTKGKPTDKPDLKITKVPLHLRSNWESFYLEFLMATGLLVYFINFVSGRNRNQNLATAWLNSHKPLLESNFALVGDDGKKEIESNGFMRVSENIYTLWCSGRSCVEGMLVELKLLKRQDLVSVLSNVFRPACDQIVIRVTMSVDAMDTFVFCLATKKTGAKLIKEMSDLITYCPEKKTCEKYGLSSNFNLWSEIGEASATLLDSKVIQMLKKYEDSVDYLHFSDQYSGAKVQEDTQPTKLPEVKKMLIFGFNVPGKGHVTPETMESMKPLLQMVFYFIEKIKRFHLSKEAKWKAEKSRQRVEEAFLKTTHAQRQEAAQVRREEKRRAEKERIMNEEDPEKQRKWEEREHRRELKKKAPKMKQLKVKAL